VAAASSAAARAARTPARRRMGRNGRVEFPRFEVKPYYLSRCLTGSGGSVASCTRVGRAGTIFAVTKLAPGALACC
jgi:hypothetical protein